MNIPLHTLAKAIEDELRLATARHHRAVLADPIPLDHALVLIFFIAAAATGRVVILLRREPDHLRELQPFLVAVLFVFGVLCVSCVVHDPAC